MFDIGFSELVLIGVLALLVLGPKRLPEVARTAGRWMAQLRRFVTNVKQDFDRELHGVELAELRKLKQELDETRRAFADSGSRMMQNLADVGEKRSIPHPDDPVTEPVILPPRMPVPTAKPKTRRTGASRKVAAKHGRPATQRPKPGKRR
jgi:sec-independent protein translocase protein TatB